MRSYATEIYHKSEMSEKDREGREERRDGEGYEKKKKKQKIENAQFKRIEEGGDRFRLYMDRVLNLLPLHYQKCGVFH